MTFLSQRTRREVDIAKARLKPVIEKPPFNEGKVMNAQKKVEQPTRNEGGAGRQHVKAERLTGGQN